MYIKNKHILIKKRRDESCLYNCEKTNIKKAAVESRLNV